jgi:hypothetical protein
MSCGHWLSARRVHTLARETGMPVVAARRCTGTLILATGEQIHYDFVQHRVVGPERWPGNYVIGAERIEAPWYQK